MNRVRTKRVALQLVGILLLIGCDGAKRKSAPVDGGMGGNGSPPSGGASGAGYGGNGGGGTTTGSAPNGDVLGLGGNYSFGTREPWAGVADAGLVAGADAGFVAVADAGSVAVADAGSVAVADAGVATTLGPSTVAEACAEYHPVSSAVVVPTENDCSVVASQYERLEYFPKDWSSCYMDGTPDQFCSMTKVAQSGGACGDPDGWRLATSSTAFFGGAFGFWSFAEDYSAWDGIGVWARLEKGTKTELRLQLMDGSSEPVVDPTTGYPSCYYGYSPTAQDWDHDGVANLSPVPESLRCKDGWFVTLAIDQQWRFLMLPWSVWQTSPVSPASAIDPKTLSLLTFGFPPCSDFALQLGWVGAYRAKP